MSEARAGDQGTRVKREAGEGAATSMGKRRMAFRAGTVQGRGRYGRTVTGEGGAGLQKPWQMGRYVHDSKHLQRFIKNVRRDCELKI